MKSALNVAIKFDKKTPKSASEGPKAKMAEKMEGEPSPDPDKEFEEHELDGAMHTLSQAEEIKRDNAKMKALHPHIEKKIKSLADLRKVAKQKLGSTRIEA